MTHKSDARPALAALLEDHKDALAQQMAEGVVGGKSEGYSAMEFEQVKQGALASLRVFVADLREGTFEHTRMHLKAISEVRMKRGFKVSDMWAGVRATAEPVRAICGQGARDAAEHLERLQLVDGLLDAGREGILEGSVHIQEDILREQFNMVQQLSSPVMPVYEGVLVLPIVGSIDAQRGARMVETLLAAITRERALVVIIDITGVPAIDADVAGYLTQAAQASRLLGAEVVIVGVSPAIAQTMVAGQLDLRGVVTLANLKAGLEHALGRRGLVIQPRAPARAG